MKPSSPSDTDSEETETDLHAQALEIVAAGKRAGLPYIAASADVSDPAPMCGSDGKPYAESLFSWFDPDLHYWNDRTFALRSGFIQAARICAEPFYFDGDVLKSWRPNRALEVFNENADYESFGVASAIICPCYMPYGILGAIVWATNGAVADIAATFAAHAPGMHLLTLKFLSAYRENVSLDISPDIVDLTRREIQCLKWAALGKTDSEIGKIMSVSVPTVRFHLTNAGRKLGVSGRAQAVRVATSMGYIGRRA
jgi:DNA-binding CsgD family transcriptional regulator